jgi:hypothetical protein
MSNVKSSCFNYVLNISLSYLTKVASVKNIVNILTDVIAFFNGSAKRQFVLKNIFNYKLK